ncbi:MAG: hypothetical protein FWF81_06415 [Defluviitaleaceae bacterium]|nr:hypothetical protein [Defluviitaleaceae bacterium]
MKQYVFDACALIALINDEDGADVVERLLVDASLGICGISLADAMALAQASVENAPLVTAVHHELDAVEADGKVEFYWIR